MPLSDQETAFQPVRLMSQASHGWVVLQEAAGSFVQNAGLRQASSLAFYSTLSLIPALLLLTFLLSLGIGSSQAATQKTAEFVGQVIPTIGEVILKEVRHLASHPRQIFSRDQLLDKIWGLNEYIDPATVTVHMRRLREKIEIDSSKPQHILTVWGVGYRFEP